MLRTHLNRRAAWTAEDHGDGKLPSAHLIHLRCVVDDLIDCHQREVKAHELDDGSQADHGRPDTDARESEFGNGRVYDAPI